MAKRSRFLVSFLGRGGQQSHFNLQSNRYKTAIFASACKKARLEGVTPHTLRHTCASWLVARRPILEVRDILGHSAIKMTEMYTQLAPENLVDPVSSIENWLRFGSTATCDKQLPEDVSSQVIDKMDEKWWARKDTKLRPMDYESKPKLRRLH